MLSSRVEVIDPMAGRRMHQACPRLGGDVVTTDHNRAFPLQQRVSVAQAFKLVAFDDSFAAEAGAECCSQGVHQVCSHDQKTPGAIGRDGVIQSPVDRHR